MCGIAGYIGRGSAEDLQRMIGRIRYRGPDDAGVFVAPHIGLAHARLSIIDLSAAGHQPMWNADHTVAIVFNGEIYNFQELKKDLVGKGHRFVSTSDTEVIIALYVEYGTECFRYLNGMFAVAIFDTRTSRLLLGRDRIGKKPLYYTKTSSGLVFASEPKAILAHSGVTPTLHLPALHAYLALDYVPTPLSIYSEIAKLEPGSWLSYQGGEMTKGVFWTPDMREVQMSDSDARAGLETALTKAVGSRLVADVPLGVFLSGGLDSGAVAHYAQKALGGTLRTFSVGFEEASFDESVFAKEVASFLRTTHFHTVLKGADGLAAHQRVVALLDEPMADPSIIPTNLLAGFAKEHVTVALGGDGGDELFAGYPTFQAERAIPVYAGVPTPLRHLLARGALALLPQSEKDFSLRFKLEKFLDGADDTAVASRHMKWLGTWRKDELRELLLPDVFAITQNENPYASAIGYFDACNASEDGNKLLFAYMRTYLMDQVLVKVDRASMYASLEVRAPLLDYELVEFVGKLPYAQKLHGLTTKYILKKHMQGKLPAHIIHRKKKGFGVPVAAWLRGPLREWAGELLSEESIRTTGLFESAYVSRLWGEHLRGERDHRKKLWNLLVFLEWQRNFLK